MSASRRAVIGALLSVVGAGPVAPAGASPTPDAELTASIERLALLDLETARLEDEGAPCAAVRQSSEAWSREVAFIVAFRPTTLASVMAKAQLAERLLAKAADGAPICCDPIESITWSLLRDLGALDLDASLEWAA